MVEMAWSYGSFAGWWSFTLDLAGALSAVIARLTPEQVEAVRTAAAERAAPFAPDYVVPGACWNVTTL